MNLLTVSAVGLTIFVSYLLVAMFLLRSLVAKFPNSTLVQGVGALIA